MGWVCVYAETQTERETCFKELADVVVGAGEARAHGGDNVAAGV